VVRRDHRRKRKTDMDPLARQLAFLLLKAVEKIQLHSHGTSILFSTFLTISLGKIKPICFGWQCKQASLI
jgi:hypothetical protein